MPGEPLQDGSKRFVLRGGKADGVTVRLYPHNQGWEEVLINGELYVAPDTQDPRKPFLMSANALRASA
jgi:hypothetical protein